MSSVCFRHLLARIHGARRPFDRGQQPPECSATNRANVGALRHPKSSRPARLPASLGPRGVGVGGGVDRTVSGAGETSCLTLVWPVLDLDISHATDGIKLSQLERQQLKRTR